MNCKLYSFAILNDTLSKEKLSNFNMVFTLGINKHLQKTIKNEISDYPLSSFYSDSKQVIAFDYSDYKGSIIYSAIGNFDFLCTGNSCMGCGDDVNY